MVAPARSVSPMFIGTSLVPVVGRGLFDDGVSLNAVVGCSPLVEDGGVGVGGAEGEDGAVAHERGSGGQLGGSLVVG